MIFFFFFFLIIFLGGGGSFLYMYKRMENCEVMTIINSLISIFISTGQEIFLENL